MLLNSTAQAGLLDTRRVVYLTLGQDREAIKDLEQAVAIAPTAVEYFHLSQAYHAGKDEQAASKAYHNSLVGGLTESTVHPLEQKAYKMLPIALAGK